MVHGYHVIIGAYGYWLPNDPRGSWSDFVGKWELLRFGKATKSLERKSLQELTADELRRREEARQSLEFPPVQFSGLQARAIGRGFAAVASKRHFTIWACAILPEHTHVVIARHRYKVERVVNALKGEATRSVMREGIHPLRGFAPAGQRPPQMWSTGQWKVYLDCEESIDNAIAYVNRNPLDEGKPAQHWSCVKPFYGLDAGWTTYHSD
jgi:REP element-mobilizing transposase RayT